MHFVERSCREVSSNGSEHQLPAGSRPLSEPKYRNLSAYVLIGDPGAGKTTAFEQECAALGDGGEMVTARDFLTFEDRPEWHRKTLFLDGLDEIRAGAQDVRTPFDAIRARLDKLGRPRFRLSCRGADWLGALDQDRLAMVSPNGRVPVLILEPLTESDVREILEQGLQVEDAGKFMEQAERKGLRELLSNPQTLDLLTEAVAAGAWPETRRETFELACRKLIGERNPEHRSATASRPVDVERSLRAAGFLCAVQIIAGKAGYALAEDKATKDFPWLGELGGEDRELFASVVRTRLFKFSGSGLIAPVHLHLAEYLAARHLAGRIEQSDFPVGRIFASITGTDGIVVSQLRGLSAWLATLCASRRDFIIDRDSMGVALYGDIEGFSTFSKSRLLENLCQCTEAHRFLLGPLSLSASPQGASGSLDMRDSFQLSDADFPVFHSALLSAVRDPAWHWRLRRWALGPLLKRYRKIQGCAASEELKVLTSELKTLAEEIRNGGITDPSGDLMGMLLFHLYPNVIPPSEILDYLYAPHRLGAFRGDIFRDNTYTIFWEWLVAWGFSAAEVVSCLDRISSMAEVFQPTQEDLRSGWGARLVMRGLREYGEAVDSKRLHQWLGIVSGECETPEIQEWMKGRPIIQTALLDRYFDQCSKEENLGACIANAKSLLFKERHPLVFGRWCLEKLPEAESGRDLRYLAEEAMFCHEDRLDPLPWEKIENAAKKSQLQENLLDEALREIKSGEKWRRDRLIEQDAEVEFVRANEIALREGDAPLELLRGLAQVYWGRFSAAEGATPLERLQLFLRLDSTLVLAAATGLMRSIHHPKMPSVSDIVQLRIDGKIHSLTLPVLAGLELEEPGVVRQNLSDAQWCRACAFHLMYGESSNPRWYSDLAANRPKLVAEMLQTCVTAILKSNQAGHWTLGVSLHVLAFDVGWAREVVRLSAMPMLHAFPVRASKWQLAWLNAILHAAIRHSDQAGLLALIRRKTELGSMNVGTRIRWLAAGMLVAPEKYMRQLADFVSAKEKRVRHLAYFCVFIRDAQCIPTPTIELLLRKIGEFYVPHKDPSARATLAEEASDLIYRLLVELGSRPMLEATDALARLSAEPKLEAWQYVLQVAIRKQLDLQREMEFQHLNVSQVRHLLNGQRPANADDLKALTEMVLQEVSDWIRNGDTDGYRQYWNEGPRRELESPKHEEACRDALLSELRQHLARFGVMPEAHRADDARTDAVVAVGGAHGFEVPIEIKKSTSPDLWRAMHDQLIVKYARDPRASGRGLYVVFWFGADQKQPSPPQGAWPRTADELEARLRDTLSAEEARKIAVCVVDVAAPE